MCAAYITGRGDASLPAHFIEGAPRDVTLSEIAIETLLPADEATAKRLQQLKASLPA